MIALIVVIVFIFYYIFNCFKQNFFSFKRCHWAINYMVLFTFLNILCQIVFFSICHIHINDIISNFFRKNTYCFQFFKITGFITSFVSHFASINYFSSFSVPFISSIISRFILSFHIKSFIDGDCLSEDSKVFKASNCFFLWFSIVFTCLSKALLRGE